MMFTTFQEVNEFIASLSDEKLAALCREIYDWKYLTGTVDPEGCLGRLRNQTQCVDNSYIVDCIIETSAGRFFKVISLLFRQVPHKFLRE